MIGHFWHTLRGPQWVSAGHIYEAQVKHATNGAVFVEVGSWKGRSNSFMAVGIATSSKSIQFHAIDHWLGSLEEEAHAEDEDVRFGRLYEVFSASIASVRDY